MYKYALLIGQHCRWWKFLKQPDGLIYPHTEIYFQPQGPSKQKTIFRLVALQRSCNSKRPDAK